MELHETIYRLRTARGLSQLELAEALEVSRQSISKWETGAAVPELDKLVRLSDVFGITLDELVRGTAELPEMEAEPETSPAAAPAETPRRMEPYRIVALALLCTFLVLTVLLAGFGGTYVALTVGLPLIAVCAVFLMLARRHLLWGFWLLWLLALAAGKILTGGYFFSWAVAGPLAAVMAIALIGSLAALVAATVRRLKR